MADNSIASKIGIPVVLPVFASDVACTPATSLTNTTMSGRYSRTGSKAKFHITFAFTGTPGAAALSLTATQLLNGTGLTFDSTLPTSGTDADHSTWHGTDSGVQNYAGAATLDSSGTLLLWDKSGTAQLTTTSAWAMSTADSVTVTIEVPILQWAGGYQAYGAGQATSVTPGLVDPYGTTGVVASGTYTPTVTGVTNVSAISSGLSMWSRVGRVVTVGGQFTVTPSGAGGGTPTTVRVSLPLASVLTVSTDVAGSGARLPTGATAGMAATIIADVANAAAQVDFRNTDNGNIVLTFAFTYLVK